jgi:hypothetical protein
MSQYYARFFDSTSIPPVNGIVGSLDQKPCALGLVPLNLSSCAVFWRTRSDAERCLPLSAGRKFLIVDSHDCVESSSYVSQTGSLCTVAVVGKITAEECAVQCGWISRMTSTPVPSGARKMAAPTQVSTAFSTRIYSRATKKHGIIINGKGRVGWYSHWIHLDTIRQSGGWSTDARTAGNKAATLMSGMLSNSFNVEILVIDEFDFCVGYLSQPKSGMPYIYEYVKNWSAESLADLKRWENMKTGQMVNVQEDETTPAPTLIIAEPISKAHFALPPPNKERTFVFLGHIETCDVWYSYETGETNLNEDTKEICVVYGRMSKEVCYHTITSWRTWLSSKKWKQMLPFERAIDLVLNKHFKNTGFASS